MQMGLFRSKNEVVDLKNQLTEAVSDLKQKTNVGELSEQKINDFTYLYTHNLRTPVANILGIISLMDVEDLGSDFNNRLCIRLSRA
ncbi:MAG: signal transduction histidine kinase [Sphingobacteriales bacterium]|jgi:signal transduction histidine kinase